MLEGNWPGHGCEYCRYQEDHGTISDRQFQLMEQQDPGMTAPELHQNPESLAVTPTILEVWFTNKCNQKCIYCGPKFSSLWEQEIKDHGEVSGRKMQLPGPKLSDQQYQTVLQNLWTYLEKKGRYLRRFGILGGEPFLHEEEIMQCLDFWEQNPNPDLILYFVTNLNLPKKLLRKYYDKIDALVSKNCVWKVQITASLDGWGPEQELTRFGLDLEKFESNFIELAQQPWSTVSINSAISALTIKTMPQMMERMQYWDSLRAAGQEKIIFSFQTVTAAVDDPINFGAGVFESSFDQLLQMMPTTTRSELNIWEHMNSIRHKIFTSTRNSAKIQNLKNYLDDLDRRRGTDWKQIFPWLIQIT